MATTLQNQDASPVPSPAASPTRVILRSPFYGYGRYVWAISPDYWPENWGRVPFFGYVSADDKFTAERVAYDVGLVHRNDTFKPKAIKSFVKKPVNHAAGE